MKRILIIAGLIVVLASCNSNYEKTASGLAYKIIKGNGKQKLQPGDIIKVYATVKIAAKDSVLYSTMNRMATYLQVDTSLRLTHDFNEVLKYCSVGDSLIAVAQVDTLVKKGMMQYNQMFKRGDQIVTEVKVLKAFKTREEQAQDQQQEMSKEQTKEVAEIEKFVQKKGIKTEKTVNGVFVEVINAGDTPRVVQGKKVTVNYKGSLMQDGKVFDTNMDTTFKHKQPFSFVVGAGQTIKGWDEAMPMLGNRGKANLYIPALLAYGPPGSPPGIPPYASLVFEVEITNVEDAPVQPQMPLGMQGNSLRQMNTPKEKSPPAKIEKRK